MRKTFSLKRNMKLNTLSYTIQLHNIKRFSANALKKLNKTIKHAFNMMYIAFHSHSSNILLDLLLYTS